MPGSPLSLRLGHIQDLDWPVGVVNKFSVSQLVLVPFHVRMPVGMASLLFLEDIISKRTFWSSGFTVFLFPLLPHCVLDVGIVF